MDITITKDTDDRFKEKIIWAIESESSCSEKDFYYDFAKLIHVQSENYLYMNGLNHKEEGGRENYIKDRIDKAEQLLETDHPAALGQDGSLFLVVR